MRLARQFAGRYLAEVSAFRTSASVSPCHLVVMPHWRPEVRDVVKTLHDACRDFTGHDGVHSSHWDAALIGVAAGRNQHPAVLFSDTGRSRLLKVVSSLGSDLRIFRLWWNGSDEIAAFVKNPPRHAHPEAETHICFFPEILDELSRSELRVICAPYAFTSPRMEPPTTQDAAIYYAGEVDISARQFSTVIDDPARIGAVSAIAWELAERVVAGEASLVAAGQDLLRQLDQEAPGVHRAAMWSVRNRCRFLIMKAIAAAFPGRLILRGSDWRRLGFEASPTSFRRAQTMSDYRRHRVSLDLGSKSTNQVLYPRSAGIMAAGGGIAMIDTGAAGVPWSTALESRRAPSIEGLITIIDRLLSADEKNLGDENSMIQADYIAKRLQVGAALADQICSPEDAR